MRHESKTWILAAVLMTFMLGACSPYAYMPARASSAPPPPAEGAAGQPPAATPVAMPEVKPPYLAEQVKIGVYEAGGFPLEFPVMSLGESNLRSTAMMFRNLASMDVEESIRGNPMDGVILLVGCDKTTPALLMGAASCDLPAIAVSGGPHSQPGCPVF